MTVRIWDRGEFERLPDPVKYKKEYRHALHCQVEGCTVVITGRTADGVTRKMARHRKTHK